MMGIPPFFRAFAAPTSVRTILRPRPRPLAVAARLRRAHRARASRCALAVHRAPTRTRPPSTRCRAAARSSPRCCSACSAQRGWRCHIRAMRDRRTRNAALERRCGEPGSSASSSGDEGWQQAMLVGAWRLPSAPGRDGAGASRPVRQGARAGRALDRWLARHTACGLGTCARFPTMSRTAARLLNLSPRGSARRLLMEIRQPSGAEPAHAAERCNVAWRGSTLSRGGLGSAAIRPASSVVSGDDPQHFLPEHSRVLDHLATVRRHGKMAVGIGAGRRGRAVRVGKTMPSQWLQKQVKRSGTLRFQPAGELHGEFQPLPSLI